ncbi:large-conductance mechanosensitive channel protein MscL [Candidatus Saccharibacteria bacterium]|nr:large-conductance mechanosensitive channel protein MscL [Candidatus Saccharibacteria bacterium]
MLEDFKKFAVRGNVVDMAVGIIIGTAFGKIITSLVNDILMPPIGMLLGGVDFSRFALLLKEKTATAEPVSINYGVFINSVLDFLIISVAIFFVVKQVSRFSKKAEATTKSCDFCKSTIALTATRCPNCTSQLSM